MHLTLSLNPEKITKGTSPALGQDTLCIIFRTDKNDWPTFINSTSSAPSQNPILVPAVDSNFEAKLFYTKCEIFCRKTIRFSK